MDEVKKTKELADNLLSRGEPLEAIKIYKKLIQVETDPHILNNLAIAYKKIGQLKNAAKYMEQSVQISRNADSLLNLANIYYTDGKISNAITCCQNSIEENPGNINGYLLLTEIFNETGQCDVALKIINLARRVTESAEVLTTLGNVQRQMKEYEEALKTYKASYNLQPNEGAALNIAIISATLGMRAYAEQYFKKSIEMNQENIHAHVGFGNFLIENKRYNEAISVFKQIDTPLSRARSMECLWEEKQYSELLTKFISEKNTSAPNVRVAAFSAFVSEQLNITDPYEWVRDPLAKVLVTRIDRDLQKTNQVISRILTEVEKMPKEWEPESKTTKIGYQTIGNIFRTDGIELGKLKIIILEKIQSYIELYFAADDRWSDYIQVKENNLTGWCVSLSKGGHQENHIHASAILSGVFYLKIPEGMVGDEGAIEFNTYGYEYFTKIKTNLKKFTVSPKAGDIVIFPSSLFHKTIPTEKGIERVSIAFDLLLNRISN